MNYCLSVRNTALRSKVDEFMIEYKDKDVIYNLIKDYPNKEYIIRIPRDIEEIDWKELYNFNAMIPLTLALENILLRPEGIRFYWAYPVSTYYELEALNNIGATQILLAPPLSFDLPRVRKNFKGKIRMIPNVALSFTEKQLYANGLYGGFIRPEDVKIYEKYVDTLEIVAQDRKQETTLFEIYHDKQVWNGNLNLLLTNLNIDIDNRGIPEAFGEERVKCRQRCKSDNICHLCAAMTHFTTQVDLHKKDIKKLLR